jgi:hypothetical protein
VRLAKSAEDPTPWLVPALCTETEVGPWPRDIAVHQVPPILNTVILQEGLCAEPRLHCKILSGVIGAIYRILVRTLHIASEEAYEQTRLGYWPYRHAKALPQSVPALCVGR